VKSDNLVITRPRASRSWSVTFLLLAVTFGVSTLPGCAIFRKFDMVEIHQEAASRQQRNPIIFIHGFIGSKLRNARTHEDVWGQFVNAIKRGKTDDLSLPIDSPDLASNRDSLVPYAIYESVAGVKFYGAILDALRDVGGYRLGDIDNPKPGDTLFLYNYDWRRDNVESAAGLGRAILQIKARLRAPDMRFDIVAHSMGGLVAQYYLKYGSEDVLSQESPPRVTYAGAPHIGRMVLIGTPLRGTMSAFRILNTGFSRTMSPAAVFTMPAIYQLLPLDGRGHLIDPQGRVVEADLYDADDWVRYRWSVFNPGVDGRRQLFAVDGARPASEGRDADELKMGRFLQVALDRARAFHVALEAEAEGGSPVPVHLFGSDCIPTLNYAVMKRTAAGPVTMFDDESSKDREARQLDKVMLVPGDGTVTADSLLGIASDEDGTYDTESKRRGFASTFFFCETHGFLPANRGFQDNLFHVLFNSPERAAPVARVVGAQ
jgi:pimeloyl-ACP methyl ester carboxylesterase